ncbi:MAG TPA: energy transducer TonB [Steroidobacteraceae bacterium]
MSQRITDWLIHCAARGAPASLSERLEEEWQADLLARPSSMSRLRFALGCCWATKLIAHEHRTSSAPVAASATASIAYLHEDSGFFSRRSTSFLLVVGLHAALFYALWISLGPTIKRVIEQPLQPRVLEPTPNREPPPLAPTQPDFLHPWIEPTIPDPPRFPPDPKGDGGVIREAVGDPQPPPLPPQTQPAHEVNRVQGGPGTGFPNPDDYYPAAEIRRGQQGNVIVQVCVDASGRLTSYPRAVQSSGNSRLDEGALVLAKAGSGHYRATTEDGKPVHSCYPLRVVFKLKN